MKTSQIGPRRKYKHMNIFYTVLFLLNIFILSFKYLDMERDLNLINPPIFNPVIVLSFKVKKKSFKRNQNSYKKKKKKIVS